MLSTGTLGTGLCDCPCHAVDSGIAFCSSCYEVTCKTIRKAAQVVGVEPTQLTGIFKDSPSVFEIGR